MFRWACGRRMVDSKPGAWPTAILSACPSAGILSGSPEARLQRLPGVEALAIADSLPPAGATRTTIYSLIEVEGRPPTAEGTGGMVIWRAVTPGYFSALGVPIVRGRGFQDGDLTPWEKTPSFSAAHCLVVCSRAEK